MLDTKQSWDNLVLRHAPDKQTASRILENPLYQNISGKFVQSHEYIAMERLYEIHSEGQYDLVVVDTPPTRNALDFLEAPRRLTRFLDHRLYKILMAPTRGFVKAINIAAQAFLRTVSKVVGGEVVQDAVTFFQAFEGMEQGFKDRAERVLDLLTHEQTSFILVTAPRRDVVDEATYFATKLGENDIPVKALVVNRMHPRFSDASPSAMHERARTFEGTDLGGLYANLADFLQVVSNEESNLAGLAHKVAPAPVIRVPFLQTDVHDLTGLGEIARHLF
jgi:anion-transporting  ArsA/GET3 family ATPase